MKNNRRIPAAIALMLIATMYLVASCGAVAQAETKERTTEPRGHRSDWDRPRSKSYTQAAQDCRSWAMSEKAYNDCVGIQWSLLHAPNDRRDAAQRRLNEQYPRKPAH